MADTVHQSLRALLVALTLAGTLAGAQSPTEDVAAGISAYDRGDFAAALQLLAPAAQRGDAAAQFHMGLLHARGEGTSKDLTAAATWFAKAAEQGNAHAQYIMGRMYAAGEGVTLDDVLAYKWLTIATAQGWWKAREMRERLLTIRMSPADIARAQRDARGWLEAHGLRPLQADD